MKKLFSYLLLFLFTFQMFGFFIEFKTLQLKVKKEIKQAIKQGVPASELTIFEYKTILQAADFKWEKEGKEFWYKGKIYDIVSNKNGILQCIDDSQEANLFAHLEDSIRDYFSKTTKGKNAMRTIGSFFQLVYILLDHSFKIQFFHNFLDMVWFTSLENSLLNISLDIATPPPNL